MTSRKLDLLQNIRDRVELFAPPRNILEEGCRRKARHLYAVALDYTEAVDELRRSVLTLIEEFQVDGVPVMRVRKALAKFEEPNL